MSDVNKEILNFLIKLFEISIVDVMPTISGISIFKDDDVLNEGLNDSFAGTLLFSGEINGFFMIKTDEQSLRVLTSNITGCHIEFVEESDMLDCIGELANIICGSVRAKAAVNGISFKLSIPFSIKGGNGLWFSFKRNANTFPLNFSSNDVHINARVVLT